MSEREREKGKNKRKRRKNGTTKRHCKDHIPMAIVVAVFVHSTPDDGKVYSYTRTHTFIQA